MILLNRHKKRRNPSMK